MVHDFFFHRRITRKNSPLSLECLLLNSCRVMGRFFVLYAYKFCHNCDFKSQTPHENGAREKTTLRKHQFNYNFILVTFAVLKYTYTCPHRHVWKKATKEKLLLYQLEAFRPRNLASKFTTSIRKQAHTLHTHTPHTLTFGKNFSWPFERNVTLYLKPSNRLNKVSHQVEQFANGVIFDCIYLIIICVHVKCGLAIRYKKYKWFRSFIIDQTQLMYLGIVTFTSLVPLWLTKKQFFLGILETFSSF